MKVKACDAHLLHPVNSRSVCGSWLHRQSDSILHDVCSPALPASRCAAWQSHCLEATVPSTAPALLGTGD